MLPKPMARGRVLQNVKYYAEIYYSNECEVSTRVNETAVIEWLKQNRILYNFA